MASNPVNELHQYFHQRKTHPRYTISELRQEDGPMRKRFLCTLELPATGTVPSSTFQEEGKNTKDAKRAAAEVALKWLKEQPGYQSGRPGEEDIWTVIARACSSEVRCNAMHINSSVHWGYLRTR
jgi:hypothetical protein